MIIDFHTHAFPDELADRAIGRLAVGAYEPRHDGTVAGLLKRMDEWHVDVSVIQPVITKLGQVKKTNEWVKSICSNRIVGFGGIYPHSEDYKKDIDFVVSLGLKGLKFHAEYQDFVLDEDKMLKIYDYALNKGLILLHHGGYDPAFQPPFRSSPRQFARLGRLFAGGTIVAAHLGGHAQWDEVEEHLAGSGIYLDTSMGFEYYSQDQFLRIVHKHGANKILFGSDSPWSNAKTEAEWLRAMPLLEEEKTAIFSGNGLRILGMS